MGKSRRTTLDETGLQALLDALRQDGFRVVGPTVRDQAIVYDDLETVGELPRGWGDRQDAGSYRLVRRDDAALFGFAVGPQSWKKYLHPPRQRLWRAQIDGGDVTVQPEPVADERFAFIGVRACELRAIAIQDRVLMEGDHPDPYYRARRDGAFIVALNCSTAGGACFCVSMDAGPRAETGFDIALTELAGETATRFVAEAGSDAGRRILEGLPGSTATDEDIAAADAVIEATAGSMGREMPQGDLRRVLMDNPAHPRWEDAAARCLSCGNCTMVCPTCFCTTVEDTTDLAGREAERSQRWDSCFTLDFSYLHGGSVRQSTRARYRQWMTHKLATWHDQFGESGCVGCGRCITWCPVGIDITEEAAAIHDSAAAVGGKDDD